MIIVRFADDFIVGFEYREDAERFLGELRGRFAKFGLELHPDKTRLIEFGRHAARNRAARGEGKPETFDFLGFTHICAKSRNGRFWVRRITISKRMRAKLKAVNDQLKRRMHQPIPEQGRWLASVVRGHMAYYAVPGNTSAVNAFRDPGHAALVQGAAAPQPEDPAQLDADEPDRDSVAAASPCDASLPGGALRRHTPKVGAQCGSPARWDLCGGPPARAVPTATVGITRDAQHLVVVTRDDHGRPAAAPCRPGLPGGRPQPGRGPAPAMPAGIPARTPGSAVRAANTGCVLTPEPMLRLSQWLPALRYRQSGTRVGTFGLAR